MSQRTAVWVSVAIASASLVVAWLAFRSDETIGIASSPRTAAEVARDDRRELVEPELVPRDDDRHDVAEPLRVASAAASAPSAATEGLDSALAWLRAAKPDLYGALSDSDARSLTELDLRDAPVTDADLAHLHAFGSLAKLHLRGTQVTDAGLAHLGGLQQLEFLDLRGTLVTGLGLPSLPTANLAALHLTGTQVTGDDLVMLPPMPKLEVLKLNSLAVDDRQLEALASHRSLKHLELDRTAITDDGLRGLLAANPSLTRIELRGTSVTDRAVAELAELHPTCELVIERDGLAARQGYGVR